MHPAKPTKKRKRRFLSIAFIARDLGVSETYASDVFGREEGVLELPHSKPKDRVGKRRYRTLRVPVDVYRRVLERMKLPGGRA